MAIFSDEAVVLRKQDQGEADRLLTLYTRYHGKVLALARGIRRVSSRKGGNLDLLTRARVQIREARGFHAVVEAKSIDCFLGLKREVQGISKAYYLCELVDSLCPIEQPLPFVFDLLVDTLANFSVSSTRRIWEFEYQLLNHLGFIGETKRRKLRSVVEGIIERQLKTPVFYYSLARLEAH